MSYQARRCPDQDGCPGSERAPLTLADPVGDDPAGSAGLWWLWGLVELRLSQAGPDSAA